MSSSVGHLVIKMYSGAVGSVLVWRHSVQAYKGRRHQRLSCTGNMVPKNTLWDVATDRDLGGLAIVSRNKFPFWLLPESLRSLLIKSGPALQWVWVVVVWGVICFPKPPFVLEQRCLSLRGQQMRASAWSKWCRSKSSCTVIPFSWKSTCNFGISNRDLDGSVTWLIFD